MKPATKHWLFFAFLLASLALLVAIVLWNWRQAARRDGRTNRPPPPASGESFLTPLHDGTPPPMVTTKSARVVAFPGRHA